MDHIIFLVDICCSTVHVCCQSCATYVQHTMTVIKLKLTNSIIGEIPTDVTCVSDTVLAGFHLRIDKVKDDGTRNASYYLLSSRRKKRKSI